ncbi:protein arginine N-methyltransferase 5-like isoform X2 [Uloborus diversus]|uniref:protein arginine N-methyltransferase 5-like isoform X2 n=1 Tax=Uloborus diversus TaxID=327109 RepID=UPI0024093E90|nr:protein arginine N-methyltransferase 5-like isoform X2 [Uloborus diversus]
MPTSCMSKNFEMPTREHVSCGLSYHNVTDIYDALGNASQSGYTFIVTPIAHPRFRREFLGGKAHQRQGAFTRSDLVLSSHDWSNLIVGKISPWINLDSPVLEARQNSERALEQEMNYAAHLCLPAIVISLRDSNCVNLARHVYSKILGSGGHQPTYNVWIHVPMKAAEDESKIFINSLCNGVGDADAESLEVESKVDTWEWWNTFRSVCNTDRKVCLALELSEDLPNYMEIQRWLGEPIKCVFVKTTLFSTNKKGFPVLSRAHQAVLKKMFKLDIQVVICGSNKHSNIRHYHQYMDHLWTTQDPDDALSSYAKGYEDFLQIPLQPLMDNLESNTYEIFEKDPTKYTEYQRAIHCALLDKVSEEEKDTKTIVLMVVGAGRGPLVRAALAAAKNARRLVKVYAVEKNPNAIVTLCAQQNEMWGDQVTVVPCDMREFNPPEKADILVSELLGSFGDNELSPECLDGAQKFLKEDGISIPSSYTNYAVPVSAPKLFSEIGAMREKDKPASALYEMSYVVHLHNHTPLSTPQPLFTFFHPNRVEVPNNTRYGKLTFKIPYNCVVHGFAGYFDTVLYKDIKLSILPSTHSPGLFSWFPIFFPLKDSVYVGSNQELDVHFWRCVSPRNVWYEWMVTKPVIGAIHNPGGRSHTIGL